MRLAHFLLLAGLAGFGAPATAQARDIAASAPVDISITIYRDPNRDEGGFDLDELGGFALVTETRRITLPPGQHRLRFEGVADGIETASAIITGLPSGVIEKNRDAALLSPSALVASAQARGGRVDLVRTDPATGVTTRTEGILRSNAENGVVFESNDGIEALSCSGLPEMLSFEASTTGLSAVPTLSVFTRTSEPIEALVQLSYLSTGFDWAADYTIDMTNRANRIDLGGWVTLANGNGMEFPNARVQVVAGRLNKETGEVEPIDRGQPIYATCWPRGSTSDSPKAIRLTRAQPETDRVVVTGAFMRAEVQDSALAVTVTGSMISEDLGDLKLYRLGRTTLASRQSKQVRLLDRAAIPVAKIYEADLWANNDMDYEPMPVLLRTRNDRKNNLGLPLPSGRVAVFETGGRGAADQRLLAAEASLRDTAIDEETEFDLFESPDVQFKQVVEQYQVTGEPPARPPPMIPGVRFSPANVTTRIEIANARPVAIQAEVRLDLDDGDIVTRANRRVEQKNGRPIFRVTIPANSDFIIRYQTDRRR